MMRAMLAGINKYENPDSNLKGCVTDVTISRYLLLEKYKIPNVQLRMVVDERANSEDIIQRLEWLVAESFVHTKLFGHYSGHGAYCPNTDYEKDDPEFDGMDELICPHDFDWAKEWTWIKDDAIYSVLKNKNPAAKLVFVFDCCHSGTVFRDVPNNFAGGGRPPQHPRQTAKSIPTPIDLLSRTPEFKHELLDAEGLSLVTPKLVQPKVNEKKLLDIPNTIIISGCQDWQTSADAPIGNGSWHGVLSYFLQKVLNSNPTISVPDLEKAVTDAIKRAGFTQVPRFSYGPDTDLSSLI